MKPIPKMCQLEFTIPSRGCNFLFGATTHNLHICKSFSPMQHQHDYHDIYSVQLEVCHWCDRSYSDLTGIPLRILRILRTPQPSPHHPPSPPQPAAAEMNHGPPDLGRRRRPTASWPWAKNPLSTPGRVEFGSPHPECSPCHVAARLKVQLAKKKHIGPWQIYNLSEMRVMLWLPKPPSNWRWDGFVRKMWYLILTYF